jgi:hypothetical protein
MNELLAYAMYQNLRSETLRNVLTNPDLDTANPNEMVKLQVTFRNQKYPINQIKTYIWT